MIKLYRMKFDAAHFGAGYLNTSTLTFNAARLYSALCVEAVKQNCLFEFVELTKQDDFFLSDGFPYTDAPFLPKPVAFKSYVKGNMVHFKEDMAVQNMTKQLNYVPFQDLIPFMEGKADIFTLIKKQEQLAVTGVVVKKGTDPYEVGVTAFRSSLYVLATQSDLFDQLMFSLQYSGIGGRRSSGLGRFALTIMDLPQNFPQSFNEPSAHKHLLLTSSVPMPDEMERAVSGALYNLEKGSGFVYSPYAKMIRKRNVMQFKSGSVFCHLYKGDVMDVRPDYYPHPVYRFAKGFFLSI